MKSRTLKKLKKELTTLRGKNGVDYLRDLICGELERPTFSMEEKAINDKRAKILRNNENTALIHCLDRFSKQHKDTYRHVVTMYPMIAENLISLLDEAESIAELHGRSSLMGVVEQARSIEDWKHILSDQLSRIEHLYFSYPFEFENIFAVFGQSLMEDSIYYGIYRNGNMDSLVELISRPGDHQQFFKKELQYFMATCAHIS